MRLSCRWASEALPAPLSPSQTASHGPPRVPGATPKAPGSQAGVASQVRNPGAQSVTHKLTYVSSAQARKTRIRPTQPRNKLRRCSFSRRPTRRAATLALRPALWAPRPAVGAQPRVDSGSVSHVFITSFPSLPPPHPPSRSNWHTFSAAVQNLVIYLFFK